MLKLLKNSGIFAVITLLSRVLGLLRDLVIAKYFAVEQTDIFFMALRIPNTLRRFFAEGGFANAFVPVLNDTKEQQNNAKLQSLINNVFGVLSIILLLITALGIIFAAYVIAVIGFGFSVSEEKLALATTMLRITFPYVFFISMTAFFAGILNTYQRFALPAFTPVLLNVALIVGALWFRKYFEPQILVLAWAVFFGGLAQFLLQIPTLWRLKLLPIPRFSFMHSGVVKILRLMLPTILGSSAGQINILLNTALASTLASGSITWLYYSDRLVELPVALIGVALGIVILPRLSALKSINDQLQFQKTLNWAFSVAFLLGSAAATGLISLSLPLITTILARGEFSSYSADMSAKSLMAFGLGALTLTLTKVLAPGFYSRYDTKTPAKIAILCIAINIVLALILHKIWGHVGLALASTITSLINCLMLLVLLIKSGYLLINARLVSFILRVILANLIMALVLYSINYWITIDNEWIDFSQLKRVWFLFILIFSGIITYIFSLFMLKLKPSYLLIK